MPELSAIEQVSADYLAALGRVERKVTNRTAARYATAARSLEGAWKDAYRRLQDAKAQGYGADYLSGYIWHEQRLATMLNDVYAKFSELGALSGMELTAHQREIRALAQQSIYEQSYRQLAHMPAGSVGVNTFNFPHQQLALQASTVESGPLRDLLAKSYGDSAVKTFREELTKGIALGLNPRQVARNLANQLGTDYGRLEMIARNEMMRTYRTAQHNTLKANRHLVARWRWSSALGMRTCVVCWAMHGQEFDIDEPMESHPVCRCAMLPVLAPLGNIHPALANVKPPAAGPTGVQQFRNLSPAQQRFILGPTAYQAYAEGKIDIDDLVGFHRDAVWGNTRPRRGLNTIFPPDQLAGLKRRAMGRGGSSGGTTAPKPLPKPKPTPQPAPLPPKPRAIIGDTPVNRPSLDDVISLPPEPGKPKGPKASASVDGLDALPRKGKSGAVGNGTREAMASIDDVHGTDGVDMAHVPVRTSNSRKNYGSYSYYGYGQNYRPSDISMSIGGSHPQLTFAHEYGHYLDQQLLPKVRRGSGLIPRSGMLSSADDPLLAEWRAAVMNSRAIQRHMDLASMARRGQTVDWLTADGSTIQVRLSRSHIEYHLQPHEMFARSYAQYIATRSGNPAMLAELATDFDPLTNFYHSSQWAEDDFEPIAQAFDRLFKEIGATD